jgi:hypothetical protein
MAHMILLMILSLWLALVMDSHTETIKNSFLLREYECVVDVPFYSQGLCKAPNKAGHSG